MNKIYAKIGEHTFQITIDSANLLNYLKKNFCIKSRSEAPIDMMVHIKDGFGSPLVTYDVNIMNTDRKLKFRRDDYLIEVDSDFQNATLSVFNGFALKHAFINLYSSFIVYHNWGLLIHSSCVVEDGKAHIFSGQSGAGKSTTARLSYPRQILSDEATLVKITPDGATVFDSPFRSELESMNGETAWPLGSIQVLYQSLKNKRVRLEKNTRPAPADGQSFLLGAQPERNKKDSRAAETAGRLRADIRAVFSKKQYILGADFMTDYFIRKPNCETVQVDDEWVILNPETYTVTKLNEAGGRCWSLLSEKNCPPAKLSQHCKPALPMKPIS
ncbi:hypothetical protein QS257_18380 [Terrilactibacillus sp. S3-3]|nr:hypothetical protein QS257_18380 [Terrilactibacillus sp. S3-3]